MATVELTAENFESVIGGADLALVDFWAAWCGPCRMFGPIFEQASEEYPDAVFGKVDTEAQQEVAGRSGSAPSRRRRPPRPSCRTRSRAPCPRPR